MRFAGGVVVTACDVEAAKWILDAIQRRHGETVVEISPQKS